jgi:GH24 family phage-related lysozyme (muramidase)
MLSHSPYVRVACALVWASVFFTSCNADCGPDATKENEGFEPCCYFDTKNLRTIGYGFNMDADLKRTRSTLHAYGLELEDVLAHCVATSGKKLCDSVCTEHPEACVTKPQATEIFKVHYAEVLQCSIDWAGADKPSQVIAAIADMAMMGCKKLDNFSNLKKALSLPVPDYATAAAEVRNSKWCADVQVNSRCIRTSACIFAFSGCPWPATFPATLVHCSAPHGVHHPCCSIQENARKDWQCCPHNTVCVQGGCCPSDATQVCGKYCVPPSYTCCPAGYKEPACPHNTVCVQSGCCPNNAPQQCGDGCCPTQTYCCENDTKCCPLATLALEGAAPSSADSGIETSPFDVTTTSTSADGSKFIMIDSSGANDFTSVQSVGSLPLWKMGDLDHVTSRIGGSSEQVKQQEEQESSHGKDEL